MTSRKRLLSRYLTLACSLSAHGVVGQTVSSVIQGLEQTSSSGKSDIGSLTVTASGYSKTVGFGAFSTAASVASALAASFSQDCQSPVIALAQGASIMFRPKSSGTGLTISSSSQWDAADFATSSFSLLNPGGALPAKPISSLSLDCTPDPAPAGATVSCVAQMPMGVTGNLSFLIDGAAGTETALDSGGSASSGALSGLAVGLHSITASYFGDNTYASTSQTAAITILNGSLQPSPVYSFNILQSDSSTSGYSPNGSITAYTDSVNGSWTLSYDYLDRLSSAGSKGFANQAQQYLCWSYDSFGNRTLEATGQAPFDGSCNTSALQSSTQASYNSSNQLISSSVMPSPPSYDGAGDILNDGTNQYLYDAEGRICAVKTGIMADVSSMVQYIYDAGGNRVSKGSITAWTCDMSSNGFSATAAYALDQNAEQVTEMAVNNGQSVWLHTNLFAVDGLFATYDLQGLHYQISDWLGTRRVQTDAFGQVEENCQSLPFGNSQICSPTSGAPVTAEDATEHHFTGKERDAESGLDYFGARYYASTMGRFSSPDDGSDQDPSNPQSWNLYSYVQNNPLSNVDPDGHTCQTNSTDGSVYDDEDGQGCSAVDRQDAQRLQNEQYDANVSGNFGSVGTSSFSAGNIAQQGLSALSSVGQQFVSYLTAPRDPSCMSAATGIGAGVGAVQGEILGAGLGGAGGVVAGGGVLSLGTGPAGAALGQAAGAGLGAGAGAAGGQVVGYFACASGGGGGGGSSFGGNQRENKQANDAKRDAERQIGKKFDRALDRKFHDEITGQGYGYHDLVEIAKGVLEGHI